MRLTVMCIKFTIRVFYNTDWRFKLTLPDSINSSNWCLDIRDVSFNSLSMLVTSQFYLLLMKPDWNVVTQVFNSNRSNSRREGCYHYSCDRVFYFAMDVDCEGLELRNPQNCCMRWIEIERLRDHVWHGLLQNDRARLVSWPKWLALEMKELRNV